VREVLKEAPLGADTRTQREAYALTAARVTGPRHMRGEHVRRRAPNLVPEGAPHNAPREGGIELVGPRANDGRRVVPLCCARQDACRNERGARGAFRERDVQGAPERRAEDRLVRA